MDYELKQKVMDAASSIKSSIKSAPAFLALVVAASAVPAQAAQALKSSYESSGDAASGAVSAGSRGAISYRDAVQRSSTGSLKYDNLTRNVDRYNSSVGSVADRQSSSTR